MYNSKNEAGQDTIFYLSEYLEMDLAKNRHTAWAQFLMKQN